MPLMIALPAIVIGMIGGLTAGLLVGVHTVNRQQEEEIVEMRASLHDQAMRTQEALEDNQWLERELRDALTAVPGGDAA